MNFKISIVTRPDCRSDGSTVRSSSARSILTFNTGSGSMSKSNIFCSIVCRNSARHCPAVLYSIAGASAPAPVAAESATGAEPPAGLLDGLVAAVSTCWFVRLWAPTKFPSNPPVFRLVVAAGAPVAGFDDDPDESAGGFGEGAAFADAIAFRGQFGILLRGATRHINVWLDACLYGTIHRRVSFDSVVAWTRPYADFFLCLK